MRVNSRTNTAETFWARVDQSAGPDACWPWIGCKHRYGVLSFNGRGRNAHSVALELYTGEPDEGRQACHHCDFTLCCNPSHLFWGSCLDNMQDKCEKERQARGNVHGRSKLTEDLVRQLRERYVFRHPVHGARAMALELGISESTVGRAIAGRMWSHLS